MEFSILYKQSSSLKDALDICILPPARLLTQMHEKYTIKLRVQMVVLMMNTWCSKQVEETKNWIKTLIRKMCILLVYVS
jgi:hypothetical protein